MRALVLGIPFLLLAFLPSLIEGDALPTPQKEEFVYFIHPTREGIVDEPTEDEARLVAEHFAYLTRLTEEGTVLLAGPSLEPPYTGIIVFYAADREAAQEIVDNDPAVQGGVFEARLSAFKVSLLGRANN